VAAERHFDRASRLDGERFAAPCRVDGDEFGRQLERARALLPAAFREHLAHVGLLVEDLPSEELLHEETPPLNPELLGLFAGVARDGQSYIGPGGELPPRIYLFKRTLERHVRCPEELSEQIRVTLYHELGHYLGMDEEDLERAGYA
jgi:predicted Zn-dependent protease with MMP-like domain